MNEWNDGWMDGVMNGMDERSRGLHRFVFSSSVVAVVNANGAENGARWVNAWMNGIGG